MVAIFAGDWSDFYYNATFVSSTGLAGIFVSAALLVGNFVVVNLFVAVLVERFVHDEQERYHAKLAEQNRGTKPAPSHLEQRLEAVYGDEFAPPDPDSVLPGTWCANARELPMTDSFRGVLRHDVWNGCVMAVVLASCATLAVDTPSLDPHSHLARTLGRANLVITGFFTLEAFLKIWVVGFVCGPKSYLRSGWNCLDFFILLTSLALYIPGGPQAPIFRLLRVLRPLRLIRRVPEMGAIFQFFGQAYGDIANVTGVVFFFGIIFGVMGMELFMEVDFEQEEMSFNNMISALVTLKGLEPCPAAITERSSVMDGGGGLISVAGG